MLDIKVNNGRVTLAMEGSLQLLLVEICEIIKGMHYQIKTDSEEDAQIFKKAISTFVQQDFGNFANSDIQRLDIDSCKTIKDIDNALAEFCKNKNLTPQQKLSLYKIAIKQFKEKGDKDNAK